MSTGVIIALIVIVAAVVVVAVVLTRRKGGPHGGQKLKRRFGPEYDRVLARHDGDTKATEQELAERVQRHGDLRERPLEPAQREQFEARWTAAQERFVDAPREAVAEADRLIGEVAAARGYPDGGQYEEQLTALSVHHAHQVHGYRKVHEVGGTTATDAGATTTDGTATADGTAAAGTEDLRAAMVEARDLFEKLVGPGGHEAGRTTRGTTDTTAERTADPVTGTTTDTDTDGTARTTDDGRTPAHTDSGRGHSPWAINKRQAKES
ncbi:hypothetical protein [Streptomyces sp. NPDC008150]|uniref:hypothetical protein n=1 Tax=Streptomyces sp. NPDC008150 TaxID=3364816 RepID=UPI0036E2D1D6